MNEPRDGGHPITMRRYLIAFALGWSLCLLTTGLLRFAGDPQRYPLVESHAGMPLPAPQTFNPGRHSFLTWIDWSGRSIGDFSPIFHAAQGLASDPGYELYRPHELSEHRASFVYTPFTALLLAPFAGPDATLETVADGVSVANHLLALAGCGLILLVLARGQPLRPGLVALFVLHALLFYPLASALHLTQAGVWIFFALAVSVWALDRGLPLTAGMTLAIGASIKPHLVCVPILLAIVPGTPRRLLVGAGAGLAATAALSLGYAGWENCRAYVVDTLPSLSAGYSYFRNQGLNGLLLRVFTDQDPAEFNLAQPVPWIRAASTVWGLALLVVTVVACRRGALRAPDDDEGTLLRYAAVLTAAVLASPVCWLHHLILLAMPISIAARALLREPKRTVGPLPVLLLAGALLAGFLFEAGGLPNGWPSLFSGLELYGALLVLACLLRIQAQRAPSRAP